MLKSRLVNLQEPRLIGQLRGSNHLDRPLRRHHMQEIIVFLDLLPGSIILKYGYSVIPINLLDSLAQTSLYLPLVADSIQ